MSKASDMKLKSEVAYRSNTLAFIDDIETQIEVRANLGHREVRINLPNNPVDQDKIIEHLCGDSGGYDVDFITYTPPGYVFITW